MKEKEGSLGLFQQFKFVRVLHHDTRAKSLYLLGTIQSQDAIAIIEKTAFNVQDDLLMNNLVASSIEDIRMLDKNDVYHWYMAVMKEDLEKLPGAKVSLIWPATQTHIDKYGKQRHRMITETPEMYRSVLAPYIETMKGDRIQWVYNILSHKVEADRIVYENTDPVNGFILLPNLKWDRTTMDALYLIAIVHRRDVASIRDLSKKHIPWLKSVQREIVQAVTTTYPLTETQLRIYVHYLPSYYHFHIHVTNVEHDAGDSTGIGKAIMLTDVISRLEEMSDEHSGFAKSTLSFFLGENSELWKNGYSKIYKD
ncbi:HIT-like domain-containing protein [Lipomyces arxii]|uniref:HIT-like domain-containing protein n=1 Tax=Lipomyces arxii TaxID=56418 RepID=UPI0034CDC7EE